VSELGSGPVASRVDGEAEDELSELGASVGEVAAHETGERPRDGEPETERVADETLAITFVWLEDPLVVVMRGTV
jgi:hypothetical protein